MARPPTSSCDLTCFKLVGFSQLQAMPEEVLHLNDSEFANGFSAV